jgi:D-3-phosphoglycerate dehydrogenase
MYYMYRVLITGSIHPSGVERLQQEPDMQVDFRPEMPVSEIIEAIGPYHCLITRSETPVTREVIDAAKELKVIARAAVGVANIDIEYATEKGVLVVNTPGKNTNSAAELAFALLLAVTRKVVLADNHMRRGEWERHRFTGSELMGKTIGVIGLGNVGHRMARFCNGFDMRVLAYDPYIPEEMFARNHVEQVEWKTLLKESDIITLHVPKNKETTGMIGAAEINRMKRGVVLVNAARGGIIDEPALLDALKSGHVAAAGLDTWATEPPKENPFVDLSNVVMSPHIGASTGEAQERVAESIAEQVPRALRGGIVEAPVNMPQIRMLEGNLITSYTVLCEKLGRFAAQYMDFEPQSLEISYRGDIARHDCTLLRLAFLKGLLFDRHGFVSYVNADQRAEQIGLQVSTREVPDFDRYESAVKFTFSQGENQCAIGGVVFSGPHPRIALIDEFPFEEEPSGTFLAIRSKDRLGVVSGIASTLDKRGVLISNFAFSHSSERKRSMFLIRVGRKGLTDEVVEELKQQPHITLVRRIEV